MIVEKHQRAKELKFLPSYLIFPLILCATEVAPEVVLGLYLQFTQGQRVTKLISMSRNELNFAYPEVINKVGIYIFSKAEKDFLEKVCSCKEMPQPISQPLSKKVDEVLHYLYYWHLEKNKTMDGSDALFVNACGIKMSCASYNRYFKKAKKRLLQMLMDSNDTRLNRLGKHLSNLTWGYSIGRKTFANLVTDSLFKNRSIISLLNEDDLVQLKEKILP